MAKTPTRTNTSAGYINVGITSTQHAHCQLAANDLGMSLPEFVNVAIRERLRYHESEKRDQAYRDDVLRRRSDNLPTRSRIEFYEDRGWDC